MQNETTTRYTPQLDKTLSLMILNVGGHWEYQKFEYTSGVSVGTITLENSLALSVQVDDVLLLHV